jgi:rhamnosyltransferase
MKLAVLLSSYNGENYIKEQIESILAQQGDFTLELWVRDDGSSDSTPRILEEYARAGKLQWYTGENLKPAKSFMDLLLRCPGYDYYAFADQDDYWHPQKLQAALTLLAGHEAPAIAFANARLVDGKLQSLGRNVYKQPPKRDFYSLTVGSNIIGCTMLFNSPMARLAQEKPMPEAMYMHDYYLLMLCTLYGGTVFYDETPYMDYRQHGGNVIGAKWTKWDALKDRIHRITKPAKVSIAAQAQSMLALYPDAPAGEKLTFLRQVATYRDSFGKALKLACSRKPKFNGKNMEMTIRLAILLRNR